MPIILAKTSLLSLRMLGPLLLLLLLPALLLMKTSFLESPAFVFEVRSFIKASLTTAAAWSMPMYSRLATGATNVLLQRQATRSHELPPVVPCSQTPQNTSE
jgi:hypothetical protein